MDCWERGSRARGVHFTRDTWRMRTARVNKREEADARLITKDQYEIWKKGREKVPRKTYKL